MRTIHFSIINIIRLTTLEFIFMINGLHAFAQVDEINYLDENWKITSKENATYKKSIYYYADSIIKKETIDLKKNEVIRSESMKNNEPVGEWIIKSKGDTKKLDYNFDLVYSKENCKELNKIDDWTNEIYANESESLVAFYKFISDNLIYPQIARNNGIYGRVYIQFEVTNDNKIENIAVRKGLNSSLDKEAVRVLRLWNNYNKGGIELSKNFKCNVLPIDFRLN